MDLNDVDSQIPPFMLGGSLWAIRADALPRVLDAARGALRTGRLSVPAAAAASTVAQPAQTGPGVAVIPLTGVLTPHGSMLSWLFGGDSRGVQGFRDSLARAVGNAEVAAIVLDIDSPGGSVGLVPEAAADVRAAREIKPVIAVANTMAASGAYYIGAQADELYVTPSGMVGSVGVYYVHEDWSKANEEFGVDITYIYAGKYKTEGNPDEPLSDEGRARWQADADTLYAMFTEDVAKGRGVSAATVRSDYGEGRCLLAQDAVDAAMVDGIDTLQAVLARTLETAVTSSGASARRVGRIVTPSRGAQAAAGEPEPEVEPPAPEDPQPADPAATAVDHPEPDPAPEPEGDPEAPEDPPVDPEPADPAAAAAARREAIDLLLA